MGNSPICVLPSEASAHSSSQLFPLPQLLPQPVPASFPAPFPRRPPHPRPPKEPEPGWVLGGRCGAGRGHGNSEPGQSAICLFAIPHTPAHWAGHCVEGPVLLCSPLWNQNPVAVSLWPAWVPPRQQVAFSPSGGCKSR